MKKPNKFNTPWILQLDRDGTEDIASVRDAEGDEIVQSRPFWMPEGNDPVPPTLAALQLMVTAPDLLKSLEIALIRDRKNQALRDDERRAAKAAIARATGKSWGKAGPSGCIR